jgi:hypothetical protein
VARVVRSLRTLRRDPLERLWAWLYTGPLGHLYGIVADISLMWVRYGALLARRRLRGRGG